MMCGKPEVHNENLQLTNKLNWYLKLLYKNSSITKELKFSLSPFPYENHWTLHLSAYLIEFPST